MKPLIIPIFLPNGGCRERCLFCNQKAPVNGLPSPSFIRDLIEASLTGVPYAQMSRKKQVAFYGGSFTAIRKESQIHYLKEVQPFLASGLIHSIRVSTRPDALDEEALSLLKGSGVKTVEIGVQSMIDEVLLLAKRGHTANETVSAVQRLRRWDFEIGTHLMVGLPGDTIEHFQETIKRMINLKPDFVRIHPTLVLRGAPLEMPWRAEEYSPLSLNEAVRWLKKGILQLERASIPVARIGLQPTQELERDFLAGPYHPALHQLIDSEIFLDMATSLLHLCENEAEPLFICHPKDVSNLRGQRSENIQILKDRFMLKEIFVQSQENVSRRSLVLRARGKEVSTSEFLLSME